MTFYQWLEKQRWLVPADVWSEPNYSGTAGGDRWSATWVSAESKRRLDVQGGRDVMTCRQVEDGSVIAEGSRSIVTSLEDLLLWVQEGSDV